VSPAPPGAWALDEGVRVRIGECVYVSFERTRRLDPGDPPLAPPSYGAAPIAPGDGAHGADLIVPVRDDEAIWLGLSAVDEEIPCAVRVIVREPVEVDAATGAPPVAAFSDSPQNYVVVPPQHAVTGVAAGGGVARQFVRTERPGLHASCHVLQLVVRAAARRVAAPAPAPPPLLHEPAGTGARPSADRAGLVVQRLVTDPHGLARWRRAPSISVSVALTAPEVFTRHTGRAAPGPLTDATRYGGWRLP
jgi:hypothetical protein